MSIDDRRSTVAPADRQKLRFLLCLFIFAGLSASCAPIQSSEEVIQEVVSSWIGIHKDEMIAQFGPPLRESKLSDGSTVMVWEEVKTRYRKGYADRPGQYYYVTCQTLFRADTSGIIETGRLKDVRFQNA